MPRILGNALDDGPIKEESWPKACGCGSSITEDGWERMSYIGIQRSEFDDIPDLELRRCSHCHSSLAIAVPRDFINMTG